MQEPMGELKIRWDQRKAKSNLRKHKVSFEEAATAFRDPLSLQSRIPITPFLRAGF